MKKGANRVGGPYDDAYADKYDNIWGKNPVWNAELKFHLQTIEQLQKPAGRWLDVGCGTGLLLSKFPEYDRMGLDLSKAMLRQARKSNPDVQFVHQNMADENIELERRFDLVTCTGQPWSYLPTFDAIERAVSNLAAWTAEDGKCMLTPVDISDFMTNQLTPIFDVSDVPNETSYITGIFWNYKELDEVYHQCISPNLDQWIRWFGTYFRKVEIMRWPHEPAFLLIPRRVIVCSDKRQAGDKTPVEIIMHPIPGQQADQPVDIPVFQYISNRQLLVELMRRIKSRVLVRSAIRRILQK